MKRKNKKEILDLTKGYIKIGEKCRDCMHSEETLISTKIKCTLPKPKTTFHEIHGWICFSFSEKMLSINENEGRNDLN